MDTTLPVEQIFPHMRIVMGTVVGLGITRILMGFAGLVQHPKRARLSAIHLLWAVSILVELVHFWWWQFDLFIIKDWTFELFIFVVAYAVVLFLLAALLFPDSVAEYDGYEDFFLKRRHWFFGLLAAGFILDFIDTLIKGAAHFARFGLEYAIQVPLGIVLCIVAMKTANRYFHLSLVIAHLVYQISWISRLFTHVA